MAYEVTVEDVAAALEQKRRRAKRDARRAAMVRHLTQVQDAIAELHALLAEVDTESDDLPDMPADVAGENDSQ